MGVTRQIGELVASLLEGVRLMELLLLPPLDQIPGVLVSDLKHVVGIDTVPKDPVDH